MENFKIENDINLICITAKSFPNDVMNAHQTLHSLIGHTKPRRIFGISNPDQTGTIIYKAAVEEINPNEAEDLNLDRFIIKKGNFASIYISNYMDNLDSIGKAFQILLTHPSLDPQGYCLEEYIEGKDVRCMVPLI